MSNIPAEKISEIRDRADIERVIGDSVQLARKGRRLWGLCPFHREKSPSFTVDPSKRLYHCFGCQVGGDVFDFVMRMEGLEFLEAVRSLAKQTHVTLPEREESREERQARAVRAQLFELNARAKLFFERELAKTPAALRYLREDRGLSDETLTRFNIGWAPPGWSQLSDHLASIGADEKAAVQLGLLGRRTQDGGVYDRLRARIVFPIELSFGEVSGFGSRRAEWIDGDSPKYMNSPESPIYDKSSTLYGLHLARDPIRRSRYAVLVEGYVDVVTLHQHGIPLAVAACGTALTERHAATLARLAPEVVSMYDGDLAGQEATRKTAEVLYSAGVTPRVVVLPTGDDPDTFVRREGHAALAQLIDEAPAAIDYFLIQARNEHSGAGIAGMIQAVESVKPLLLAVKDPLKRDLSIDTAARRLGTDPAVLRKHLTGKELIRPPSPALRPNTSMQARQPPTPTWEIALLRLLVEAPEEVVRSLETREAVHAFRNPMIQAAVDAGVLGVQAGRPLDAPQLLEAANRAELASEATTTALRRALFEDELEEPLEECVERLLSSRLRRTEEELILQLSQQTDPEVEARVLRELAEAQKARGSIDLAATRKRAH